jgi:hypothetical protein
MAAVCREVFQTAGEQALDRKGKAFILPPPQLKVDFRSMYRIRKNGEEPKQLGGLNPNAQAILGPAKLVNPVPTLRWDDGVPAVVAEGALEPGVRHLIEVMNQRHSVIGNIGGKCRVF